MTDRICQSQAPSAASSRAKDQIAAVAKLIRDAQAQDEGRDELVGTIICCRLLHALNFMNTRFVAGCL